MFQPGAVVGDEVGFRHLGVVAHCEQVEQAFRAFLVFQLAEAEHFLRCARSLLQRDVARSQRVELVDRGDDVAIGVYDRLAVPLKRLPLLRGSDLDAGVYGAAVEDILRQRDADREREIIEAEQVRRRVERRILQSGREVGVELRPRPEFGDAGVGERLDHRKFCGDNIRARAHG